MSVNSKMTAIADAIRNLLDISGTMGLDAMASNISSITKRGAVTGTISAKSEQYPIPAGYHNGDGSVGIAGAEQAKLISENIKSGVTILGVAGSASGEIYAIISVTYPEGSVCTCSNGTTTLTAKDTSGKALFNVPAGEWEVSCTDGSETASETVVITTEGQLESIILDYTFYLFKSGRGFRSGYSLKLIDGTTYDSDDTEKIIISVNSQGSGIFNPGIDLSKFSKLYCEGYATGNGYHHKFGVSVSSTNYSLSPYDSAGNPWKAYADVPYSADSAKSVTELDISSVTDTEGYIKMGIVNNSIHVYNLWLE